MDYRSKTFATPNGRLRIRRRRGRIPKRNKLHYRYRPSRRAHGEREEQAAGRRERRRATDGATQRQKPRHQTRRGNGQATDPQPRKGNRATRVAGAGRRETDPQQGTTRKGTNHEEPRGGPTEEPVAPREPTTKERPGARNNYTTAGRGSAASSKDARPRWVIMEISRVARANTAERCGSSAGAC